MLQDQLAKLLPYMATNKSYCNFYKTNLLQVLLLYVTESIFDVMGKHEDENHTDFNVFYVSRWKKD